VFTSKGTLDLSCQQHLTYKSLKPILTALRKNKDVLRLDISSNIFETEELVKVAHLLSHIVSLREIDISYNRINEPVAQAFENYLQFNYRVIKLKMKRKSQSDLSLPTAMEEFLLK